MSLTCVVPADEFDSSLYQEMIEKFEKVIPNYYFVKEWLENLIINLIKFINIQHKC